MCSQPKTRRPTCQNAVAVQIDKLSRLQSSSESSARSAHLDLVLDFGDPSPATPDLALLDAEPVAQDAVRVALERLYARVCILDVLRERVERS